MYGVFPISNLGLPKPIKEACQRLDIEVIRVGFWYDPKEPNYYAFEIEGENREHTVATVWVVYALNQQVTKVGAPVVFEGKVWLDRDMEEAGNLILEVYRHALDKNITDIALPQLN